MAKSNTTWEKVFLGFGVLTVLSGVYLVFNEDYLIGISGSFVGLLLIYQNMNAFNQNKGD